MSHTLLLSLKVRDRVSQKHKSFTMLPSIIRAIRLYTSARYCSLIVSGAHLIIALFLIGGPYMPLSFMIVYRDPSSILASIESSGGAVKLFTSTWSSVKWGDLESWFIIVSTAVWCVISTLLPGQAYQGPATVSGFRPAYKRTGFLFYIMSLAVIVPYLWHYSVLHLYYTFISFSGILWVLAFLLSMYLFLKGHFDPSPGVFGPFDNPVFEFIRGLELYPRLGPAGIFDLKSIIHCRFSYILWQAIVLWAWKANYELHQANYLRGEINWPMTCTTILQTVYIACFYFHEETFMSSNFMSNNRCGLEFCFQSTKIITFNTLVSLYLIKYSPIHTFGLLSFITVTVSGVIFILLRFEADQQRLRVRHTRGNCRVFGQKAFVIHAIYTACDGTIQQTQLLASGLWGKARHFNYVLEILATFCWTLGPFTLASSFIPFCPLTHLICRLVCLAISDDFNCHQKYGHYWKRYCSIVRYRMIPGVY